MLPRKYAAAVPTETLVPLDCFINTLVTWWCYCTELRLSRGFHGNKARPFHSQSKHCCNHATEVLINRFVYCSLINLSFTHTLAHSLTHSLTHTLTHTHTHTHKHTQTHTHTHTHTIAHSLTHEVHYARRLNQSLTPHAIYINKLYCMVWPVPVAAWSNA